MHVNFHRKEISRREIKDESSEATDRELAVEI